MNPEQPSSAASRDPASNQTFVERYGAVDYAARSNPLSHPDRLAMVATLHGLSPPNVATACVLEIGCNNGANLLPMAVGLPDARFVGCDLSPQAIESARTAVAETGLANVTLVEGDLRSLPSALGPFDFIIAHGVYSWVPAPVRDALFALAAERLSAHGLLFVSYNVYPGCHTRQAVWETLNFHIRDLVAARERLDAARSLASALSQSGRVQSESDALLRREFARVAAATDSALYHDDLAIPNEPVYFHEFAEHARRHGLAFVSEAKLFDSSSLGVAAQMQHFVPERDRLEREQYLDFACIRRFRQSVLCRAECDAALAWTPERASEMHAAASLALLQTASQGKALFNPMRPPIAEGDKATLGSVLKRLVEVVPRVLPVAELESHFAGERTSERSLAALLVESCIADELLLHVHPPRVSAFASERPCASPVARWQARRGTTVTNQQHEPLKLADAPPRALLALLDGRRDAQALDTAIGAALDVDDPSARRRRIDAYVRQFARLGLLIG